VSRRVAATLAPSYPIPMPAKDEERAKRLAAALRENLRRRKAQARSLSDQPGGERDRDPDGEDHA